jgi:anti-sigma regulatory factor (Ser/Thr protein kinase)
LPSSWPVPVSWSLLTTPAAASQARELLSAHCVAQHRGMNPDSLRMALLLTSELVTNAVQHGTGRVDLGLIDNQKVFRVQVSDQNNDLPLPIQPDPLKERGRGLLLVEALSTSWGVTRHAIRGKTVWCELPPLPAWTAPRG